MNIHMRFSAQNENRHRGFHRIETAISDVQTQTAGEALPFVRSIPIFRAHEEGKAMHQTPKSGALYRVWGYMPKKADNQKSSTSLLRNPRLRHFCGLTTDIG